MSRITLFIFLPILLIACVDVSRDVTQNQQPPSAPIGTPLPQEGTATVLPTSDELHSVTTTSHTPSLTVVVEVTSLPVNNNNGLVVFVSETMLQSYHIYTMNIDGSLVVSLTEGDLNYSNPLWSPNGQKILFQSSRQGSPVGEDIWVMNADGTEQINLTNDFAYNSSPDWSPEGNKIVFSSERDENAEIYVINADGSNIVRLTNHPASDSHPTWSSDGSKIAFVSDRSGSRGIHVMNADGTDIVRLTEINEDVSTLRWSTQGQQIAFTSHSVLWVMNTDGSERRNMSSEIMVNSSPRWAPNGQDLIFAGQGPLDIHTNIYLVNIRSGKTTRLTDDTQGYTGGSWSPDATRIIISGGPYLGIHDLYIIDINNLEITRLTNKSGLDCCADWQPSIP